MEHQIFIHSSVHGKRNIAQQGKGRKENGKNLIS